MVKGCYAWDRLASVRLAELSASGSAGGFHLGLDTRLFSHGLSIERNEIRYDFRTFPPSVSPIYDYISSASAGVSSDFPRAY